MATQVNVISEIFRSLITGPKTIYQLEKITSIPKKTLYKYLTELKEAGYLVSEKVNGNRGRPKILYRLKSDSRVLVYDGIVFVYLPISENAGLVMVLNCPYYDTCLTRNCLSPSCYLMKDLPEDVRKVFYQYIVGSGEDS